MLEKHYDGISERMMSDLRTISEQMDLMGERGRNNEQILAKFLTNHLPHRFTASTEKVSATGARNSNQIDVIVHDRLDTPARYLTATVGFSPPSNRSVQ